MQKPQQVKVNVFSLNVGDTFRKIGSEANTIYKVKAKLEGVLFYEGAGRSLVYEQDRKVIIYK